MRKQHPFYLFGLVWLIALIACRQDAAAPTLTPVPTSDATKEAIDEAQNPPFYNGLAIWGGFVYFGYGRNLYWLDVAEPTNPVIAGSLALPNRLHQIRLQGDEAHLVLNTPDFFNSPSVADGWQRVNLADPARPQLTTFYDAFTNLYDVLLYQDTAYLSTADSGLLVLDVSDAAAPHFVAAFTDLTGPISALAIFDHYLLVVSANCFRSCTSTLNILDVSTPQQPQIISQWEQYGHFPTVIVNAPHIILAGTAIITIDLTKPETPKPIGELPVPEYSFDAVLQENWLYAATEKGLITFDLTHLGEPQRLQQTQESLSMTQVALDDDLLVVSSGPAGIWLYSLADAAAPQQLAHFQLPADGEVNSEP